MTKDEADYKLIQIKAYLSILSHKKEFKEVCSELINNIEGLREYIDIYTCE